MGDFAKLNDQLSRQTDAPEIAAYAILFSDWTIASRTFGTQAVVHPWNRGIVSFPAFGDAETASDLFCTPVSRKETASCFANAGP